MRRAFLVAVAPLAAWVAAMMLLFPHLAHLCLGIGIGATLAMYACVIDSPPEWIAKWGRGADGERRTGRALSRLAGDGWSVVHGLHDTYGDRDHVLVGCAGVFVLETKNLGGTIAVERGGVVCRHTDDPLDQWSNTHIARRVKGSAARLQRDLAHHGVQWVSPVVVLWGDFPAGRVVSDGVTYLHGSRLAEWLTEQRPMLASARVAAVGLALRDAPRAARLAPRAASARAA